MAFAALFGFLGMYFHNRRTEQWHQTARLALEKGQPLPTLPDADIQTEDPRRESSNDVRSGLILIGVGIGLYLFLSKFISPGLGAVGAIPASIGVAMLLYRGARLIFSDDHTTNPPTTPRS